MSGIIDILPYEEQIPLRLRALYEQYAYKKYSMSNFEPYDLYSENRNFIKNTGIITFTDMNGRLMALRPDVTTSIVKHAGEAAEIEKLYYIENVFRMQQKTREYREIRQMGIEYIGGGEDYPEAEVVFLAIKSLDSLGGDYRLNVSHMGLVEGILDFAGFNEDSYAERIRDALKHRNTHDIISIAKSCGIGEEKINILGAFCTAGGEWDEVFKHLENICVNEKMSGALSQLKRMKETVSLMADTSKLQLDVSVINDMDYYNGTVFRGYIKDAEGAVLSGGRYDNMMKRFGKTQAALGFAFYLGELERAFHCAREYDADVLLLANGFEPKLIAAQVAKLSDKGCSVYVCGGNGENIKAKKIMLMTSEGAKEVGEE